MSKLKKVVQRGMMLGAAVALFAATIVPSVSVFADALNPLTDRSLTLSSSSPGWSYTDGSGNTTYAPPNSGANGQKTGNYFSFKPSSSATVKTFSFQYCTFSAGDCYVPGDDVVRGTDTDTTSDLDVNFPSAAEIDNADFATVIDTASGAVKAVPGYVNNNPKYQFNGGTGDAAEAAKDVAGNFIVMFKNGGTWEQSEGWSAEAHNVDDGAGVTNNYITLTNGTGQAFTATQEVKILFFATATDYITNPGSGAFFVKINSYNDEYDAGVAHLDLTDLAPASDAYIIDGGVTVANVMNQSIQITTKVLETMQFSVGTVDPNTLTKAQYQASDFGPVADTHTSCDRILTRLASTDTDRNVLQLGNQAAESSLETDTTYATHSYWRLSSNSSAGATVYYSGHTLSNTVGDEIDAIGTGASISRQGSEQFGLALATTPLTGGNGWDDASYGVDYSTPATTENGADNAALSNLVGAVTIVDDSVLTDLGATALDTVPDYTALNASFHLSRLDPLIPSAEYASGSGNIQNGEPSQAQFAFDPLSDTVPAAIASEDTDVVDCVTGKMRYMANIAATTPAGIYTTKINYIAAPQY